MEALGVAGANQSEEAIWRKLGFHRNFGDTNNTLIDELAKITPQGPTNLWDGIMAGVDHFVALELATKDIPTQLSYSPPYTLVHIIISHMDYVQGKHSIEEMGAHLLAVEESLRIHASKTIVIAVDLEIENKYVKKMKDELMPLRSFEFLMTESAELSKSMNKIFWELEGLPNLMLLVNVDTGSNMGGERWTGVKQGVNSLIETLRQYNKGMSCLMGFGETSVVLTKESNKAVAKEAFQAFGKDAGSDTKNYLKDELVRGPGICSSCNVW